jgi:hypothetical protein
MNVYHFPTLNFFDINNSFVVSPCSCDDDITISQSHLLCRILVHEWWDWARGIPSCIHDSNVAQGMLVELCSVHH